MKLLVLIVLIISSKSSLANEFKSIKQASDLEMCSVLSDKKDIICTKVKSSKVSNFELNDLLIEKLDHKGMEYEMSDVLANSKVYQCLSKKKINKISCISTKKLDSDKKSLTKYVEDLF